MDFGDRLRRRCNAGGNDAGRKLQQKCPDPFHNRINPRAIFTTQRLSGAPD
jgi:hypothetical protein